MLKKFIANQKVRGQLIKCFKGANLYDTYKSGSKTTQIYPKIVSTRDLDDRLEVVFILLTGMNPKDVVKSEHVFKQQFGSKAEIETDDIKKCVLNVYKKSMPKELTYNRQKVAELTKSMKLPIVAGVDKNGQYVAFDAVKNGEMNGLIAGEPGAGKSTQLRQILVTLIRHLPPERLNLYLADLKLSEFHIFNRIAHLKHDICVTPADLEKVLSKIKKEMKKRGTLLKQNEVSHVDELPKSKQVPYIGLFIDEVVMLQGKKDIISDLVQIVSLGRALGIFTMFSLQRPSHDILDTKIRALLSVRMGFRTADASNSRIVGTPGSEKISQEDRGRFILKREGLLELQAPYMTLEKAKELLETYKVEKTEEPEPVEVIEEQEEQEEEFILGVLDHGPK